MNNNDYCLKFYGNPVFWGTYEKCTKYMSREYPTNRLQRWCTICSPEQIKESVETKLLIGELHSKVHSAPSYSSDGDVVYYH